MQIHFKILLVLLFLILVQKCFSQDDNKYLVQFSGIVVTADSLEAVPFAHIIIKNTRKGTVSDFSGYFSFVARRGDAVVFSSIGFKKSIFKIPDSLKSQRYSVVQMMQVDTLYLTETVIYPWPSKEQFAEAFVELDVPDDDYERAIKNLAREELKHRAEYLSMDGSMNYRNYIDNKVNELYWTGQYRPNNLLNPIAWAKFIQAWKNGDFKRKDK